MASLIDLLPRLEQGAILQSSRGESIRPLGYGRFEWLKSRGYRFEPETVTLKELKDMRDMWDWHVLQERTNDGSV
jgi:hypothetical protein